MKAAFTVVLALLSAALLLDCGGAGKPSAATNSAQPASYLHNDGDRDNDDFHRSPEDDEAVLYGTFGKEAKASDRRAIAAAVKSYYAAMAAGDASRACALLETGLTSQLAGERDPTTPAGRAACAAAVAPVLGQQHIHPAGEVATMVVIGAHVKGDIGLAVFGFRKAPLEDIAVIQEGGAWKVGALAGTLLR